VKAFFFPAIFDSHASDWQNMKTVILLKLFNQSELQTITIIGLKKNSLKANN